MIRKKKGGFTVFALSSDKFNVLGGVYPITEPQILRLLLFSHSVLSNSLRPHGLQHARLPCPSLSPGICSNSCPLSQWCHPTISSSVTPFSCLQSSPASEPFSMSWPFISGGQSTGASASASVLPVNIQGWFPLWKYAYRTESQWYLWSCASPRMSEDWKVMS